MEKERILEYLQNIEWSEELQNRIEYAVASYVVFQQDPDDHHTYCHEYHLTKEDAIADFESRDYVPSGYWCNCIVSSLHDDLFRKTRKISIESWD